MRFVFIAAVILFMACGPRPVVASVDAGKQDPHEGDRCKKGSVKVCAADQRALLTCTLLDEGAYSWVAQECPRRCEKGDAGEACT